MQVFLEAAKWWSMLASRSSNGRASGQQPFSLVAPVLRVALLLGVCGGFALASVLSVSLAMGAQLGPWWTALAQAHGRLQVFGWAGLFVLGVAFHFLPRLRGAPLLWPGMVKWALGAEAVGLTLRALSQPAVTLAPAAGGWRVALAASGVCEAVGLGLAVTLLVGTAFQPHAPAFRARPALWSVLPFIALSVICLGLSALVNLLNTWQAATGPGVIAAAPDAISVTLGLFGFLAAMAMGMSARALPLYAGLESISIRILWPLAAIYSAGLALTALGLLGAPGGVWVSAALQRVGGVGMALMGGALLAFMLTIGRIMSARGRLPARVRSLAPAPDQAASAYTRHVSTERARFGPYVALIGSASLWACLAGALLLIDGVGTLLTTLPPITLDAPRHSLAVGFIALLIAGVSVRMIPGFSGGSIASPRLVTALLALGNAAALLRVGSLLALPALAALGSSGATLDSILFGLSGPTGLAFAICLAITLWPALSSHEKAPQPAGQSA